jgi:hypothetical protein
MRRAYEPCPASTSPVSASFCCAIRRTASICSDGVSGPEVIALDEYLRTVGLITELIAKREGRDSGDFAVRTLAGAVVGIGMSVTMTAMENPEADIAALMDAGLARLEEGLPL